MDDIKKVTKKNKDFWNLPCGSHLAKHLGIKDLSEKSINKFDENYFQLYPQLKNFVLKNINPYSKVLEIGVGYGSVSGLLSKKCKEFHALDIAKTPIDLVNTRLERLGKKKNGIVGSILNNKYPKESFDAIVSIGCLHHTGDLEKGIEECLKILKPKGSLNIMIYYSYGFRRWLKDFRITFKYFLKETLGYRGIQYSNKKGSTLSYDSNNNEAAPHTDFISRKSFKKIIEKYNASCELEVRNINYVEFNYINRKLIKFFPFLKNNLGTDLYAIIKKNN